MTERALPQIRLFTFPGSNAAASAELVLAHANVPYERVQLRPGLHVASLKLRGFPAVTVPGMEIGGRKVNGSREIARIVAEELAPGSGLLPAQPEERSRVLEAERDGEHLQNAVRRCLYSAAADDPSGVRQLVDANFGGLPRFVRGGITTALIPAARFGHRVRVERGPDYFERVAELLAVADRYVADGVLGTDTPNVADFQFAPNVVALGEMRGPFGEFVRAHAIWASMQRLMPEYPVTFGIAPPARWVQGLLSSTDGD